MNASPVVKIAHVYRGQLFACGEYDLNGSAELVFRMTADIIIADFRGLHTVYLAAGNAVRIDYFIARGIYYRVGNKSVSACEIECDKRRKSGIDIGFANAEFAVICHLEMGEAGVHVAALAVDIII